MGYVVLRKMLYARGITLGQVSRELNIDLNRLYDNTVPREYNMCVPLTLEEMKLIKDTYLPDKKFEEVFESYGSELYEFDTVYKSASMQRRGRNSTHKRKKR